MVGLLGSCIRQALGNRSVQSTILLILLPFRASGRAVCWLLFQLANDGDVAFIYCFSLTPFASQEAKTTIFSRGFY